MRIAVVYFSKYGTTQKYAKELAQEVSGTALDGEKLEVPQLIPYDLIIWGAPLFAGRLKGLKKMKQMIPALQSKIQFVYLLGLAPAANDAYYQQATRDNFPPEVASHVRRFYFVTGDVNQGALAGMDRLLMKMVRASLQKQTDEQLAQSGMGPLLQAGGATANYNMAQLDDLLDDVRAELVLGP